MSKRFAIIAGTLVIAALLIAPMGVFAMDALQTVPNLTGTVFHDANQDGVLDVGEAGIEAVAVAVTGPGGFMADTTTDADGLYSFTISAAGNYTVTETDPVGYASTTNNDVTRTFDGSTPIEEVDFGDVPTTELGTIQVTVYDDVNRNRLLDDGDTPLEGVPVELLDELGGSLASGSTDAAGEYAFPDLSFGSYTVKETDPEGYYSTTPNEVVVVLDTPGQMEVVNFGDFQPAEGEIGDKELRLWEFFGVPMWDVLELRETYGWGYGNIARALFLSLRSGTPLADIVAAREEGMQGWGNILRSLTGFASLKGYNLGLIISGRGSPDGNFNNGESKKAEACGLTAEQYAAYVAQHGGWIVKRGCKLSAKYGEAPSDIFNMLSAGMTIKEIDQELKNPPASLGAPGDEGEDKGNGHGPPACKGWKKNDPECG